MHMLPLLDTTKKQKKEKEEEEVEKKEEKEKKKEEQLVSTHPTFFSLKSSQQPVEVRAIILIANLQMRELRFRDTITTFLQSYSQCGWNLLSKIV